MPWDFIDKDGFTSPQAGEFLTVGLDLTALLGDDGPTFASFLAETRSSQEPTATLSDFALGSVNNIPPGYKVKAGQYVNVVTLVGIDVGTGFTVTDSDVNYHHGVTGDNLLAASLPRGVTPAGDVDLTAAELEPIFAAAIARWSESALGADIGEIDIRVIIVDFPDGTGGQLPVLGHALGNTIWIDVNAGGFGWFIDPTPYLDEEFAATRFRTELSAVAADYPGGMDLLTVVMHELGHVLGLADLHSKEHPGELMGDTLAQGVRRVPGGLC